MVSCLIPKVIANINRIIKAENEWIISILLFSSLSFPRIRMIQFIMCISIILCMKVSEVNILILYENESLGT